MSTLGVAYLRGWKFSDLLYVTRAGMQKSMASINSSTFPSIPVKSEDGLSLAFIIWAKTRKTCDDLPECRC